MFSGARAGTALYIVLGIFLLGSGWLAFSLNVWQDEAYTLHTTGSGVGQAISRSLTFEEQPPLYFALLALWRAIDPSPVFARFFSLLCAAGAIFIAERFSRRYLPHIPSWLTAGVVAFNPFTIWAAVEMRLYALAIFWSMLLVWLFFVGFLDERPRTKARVAYAAVAIAALYTQYFLAALLIAGGGTLLVLRRWRTLGIYVATMIPVLASLLPIALVIAGQFAAYQGQFSGQGALTSSLARQPGYTIIFAVLAYLFPHGWIPSWAHDRLLNAAYGVAIAGSLALALPVVRRLGRTELALLAFAGFTVMFFWAVIDVAHQRVVFPRHTAGMLVPLSLALLAVLSSSIPRSRRSLALRAYVLVFALFSAATLWWTYRVPAKSGDWARVADYLSSNARPNDAIGVFDLEAALPLRLYFHEPIPLVPIPNEMTFARFDEHSFVLRDQSQVGDALQRAGVARRRLWLVTNYVCVESSAFYGCNVLFAYTASHYTLVNKQTFFHSTVYELDPSEAPAVLLPQRRHDSASAPLQ